MGETIEYPYQDIFGLKHLLEDVQHTLAALRSATLADAAAGYPAIIHRPVPESLHPDVRETHPWITRKNKLSTDLPIHEEALQGVADIWFDDDRKDSRRTYEYPGFIICSPVTLQCVTAANQAKEAFRARVVELREKYRELTDEDITDELYREGEWASLEHIKTLFGKAGIARICVKQVYRPIPHIDRPDVQRTKHYRKPITPMRKRTVGKQLAIFQKQLKEQLPTQSLVDAIERLKELPADLKIYESQASSELITVNYKLPPIPGDKRYGWGNQVTGVLPVFCLGTPDIDLEKMVNFSALDTAYEFREAIQRKKEQERYKLAENALLPGFHLYIASEKS